MAQATKSKKSSSSKRKSSGNSKRKSSGNSRSSNGTSPSSRATPAKATGRKKATSRKKASSTATSRKKLSEGAAAREAAANGTKAAGRAVMAAGQGLKTPLIMGGAAVAGVAGGLAVRRLNSGSRSGRTRLGDISLPIRDGRLDLDGIASAAKRVGAFGEQLGNVSEALKGASSEKSR